MNPKTPSLVTVRTSDVRVGFNCLEKPKRDLVPIIEAYLDLVRDRKKIRKGTIVVNGLYKNSYSAIEKGINRTTKGVFSPEEGIDRTTKGLFFSRGGHRSYDQKWRKVTAIPADVGVIAEVIDRLAESSGGHLRARDCVIL